MTPLRACTMRLCHIACCYLLAGWGGAAWAQIPAVPAHEGWGMRSTTAVLAHGVPYAYADSGPAALRMQSSRTLRIGRVTFEITYFGDFPRDARATFEYIVARWGEHLRSEVPIRIEATWTELEGDILGTAGPRVIRDWGEDPKSLTWYPYALADALSGEDLQPGEPDIEAFFNSRAVNWSLCADVEPFPGTYSFATVVLHELAHGLGFLGGFTVSRSGSQTVGTFLDIGGDRLPLVFDTFARDAANRALLDLPRPSVQLAQALQSNAVGFVGPTVQQALTDRRAPLYAPTLWRQGSSFSHLNETTYPRGDLDALMSPFLLQNEAITTPGQATCAILADLGWPSGPACEQLIALRLPTEGTPPECGTNFEWLLPPPPDLGYSVAVAPGPSVFAPVTNLEVTVDQTQPIRATLYNPLGQRVREVFQGQLERNEIQRLVVDGTGLPRGVYYLRIEGRTFATTQAVLVAQ